MSEEMAVSDNTTGEEAKVGNDEAATATVVEPEEVAAEAPSEPAAPEVEESTALTGDAPDPDPQPEPEAEPELEPTIKELPDVKEEPKSDDLDIPLDNIDTEVDIKKEEIDLKDEIETFEHDIEEVKRGIKRRASSAFSDVPDDEFKGFDNVKVEIKTEDYSRLLERLEAEVTAASRDLVPLRTVMATPPAPGRASKRPRKDTDGSRPSSALSSRSDGDGATDASTGSSPAQRGGRRATTEMSSPLLRVPLERGWKRELVYRAALDAHSRRNADIYYYTPYGKKLRSTREVSEHLAGTGLTVENFSFFKEPLGVDDPEKEIIRDAKLIRRVESPVAAVAAPAENKRTPKPKPPKGASPEPAAPAQPAATKSPPTKIKVKSMGSRLSNNAQPPAATPPAKPQKKPQQQQQQQQQPTTPSNTDNNNTAAWKKPSGALSGGECSALPARPPPPPPPLLGRPAPPAPPTSADPPCPVSGVPGGSGVLGAAGVPGVAGVPGAGGAAGGRQVVQPCSMSCGRGAVPSLACAACLCLYHPACAGHAHHPPPEPFLCKNCRKSSSPPLEPPPLTHKSGVSTTSIPIPIPVPVPVPVPTPVPRRVPVPVPVPAKVPRDKRVLLRMKVAGGTPDGERVWAVAGGPGGPSPAAPAPAPPSPAPAPAPAPPPPASRARAPGSALPQGLAVLNGRRFVVVPRNMVHSAAQHSAKCEDKRRGRIANGASPPPAAVTSPRRRARQRPDDTDHFTAFYNKAQERNYNVVVQIFQYLGMRDLAHCARVCKLWRQLAATPALWRHVRMKNSHVSDWGGLCAALKRHGTKRLDLRKMLLPQNDTVFWDQFAEHISTVDTLERIEMCRCPARSVEAVCRGLPGLRALSALAIRDALLDPAPLAALPLLHELRLKSMAGLSLTQDLRHLAALTKLQHLSLTSIKELGWCACDVIGSLVALESLELGECTFRAEFAGVLARLGRLRRLRLERGTPHCAAPAILYALATLPLLTRLELVNIDVKLGFDDALAACTNVQRLLIIPTYVSQSATTNRQVLAGVLRLRDSLTHLMWGVTIELLRVTELFIDQCEQAGEAKRRDVGECIPVLKPVPGCRLPADTPAVAGPPQVEILPLPTLQRLLSQQLPFTKLKLLRIPFHATWRQSLADFQ